jgi:hypothetical protein
LAFGTAEAVPFQIHREGQTDLLKAGD